MYVHFICVFFDIADQIFYAGGPMRRLWFRFGSQIREIHKFSTIIIIMMEEIFFVRMPRFLWFAFSLLTSRPPVIPDPCFYPELFLIACSGQEDWCWQLCGNIDILFKSGRHFNASCKCKQFNSILGIQIHYKQEKIWSFNSIFEILNVFGEHIGYILNSTADVGNCNNHTTAWWH